MYITRYVMYQRCSMCIIHEYETYCAIVETIAVQDVLCCQASIQLTLIQANAQFKQRSHRCKIEY